MVTDELWASFEQSLVSLRYYGCQMECEIFAIAIE